MGWEVMFRTKCLELIGNTRLQWGSLPGPLRSEEKSKALGSNSCGCFNSMMDAT